MRYTVTVSLLLLVTVYALGETVYCYTSASGKLVCRDSKGQIITTTQNGVTRNPKGQIIKRCTKLSNGKEICK